MRNSQVQNERKEEGEQQSRKFSVGSHRGNTISETGVVEGEDNGEDEKCVSRPRGRETNGPIPAEIE